MTIALGVLTPEGLVVAADTQESDGFLKTSQQKIALASNIHVYTSIDRKRHRPKPSSDRKGRSVCAVAGAGNAGYLDTITPLMIDDFRVVTDGDEDALETEFGKTLHHFYVQHVVPFAAFPAMDRPEFSVLIGATHKGQKNLLYVSEKTTLRRMEPFAAVGIGSSFAMNLLKSLWPQAWVDRKTAALIVSYVMFQVKESVEGCGKFTDIVVLNDGERYFVPGQLGLELEALFRQQWRLERDAMLSLFGMSKSHQEQAVVNVEAQFNGFRRMITTLAKKLVLE